MKLQAVVTGLILTLLLLAVVSSDLPYYSEDSGAYLRMASPETAESLRPFALRIVHTGAAGIISRQFGLDLYLAFLAVALASCWLLVACTAWIHRRSGLPLGLTIALIFTWQTSALLRDATLPDMLNAGLIAACFAVMSVRPWWALVLLLLATLGRETTMLLALTIGATALGHGRRGYALVAVLTGAVGLVVVDLLTTAANVHDIGSILYLVMKAPFNLSRNVLGLELWVNTIQYCEPRWTWELPTWLRIGAVHSVGYCGFNPVRSMTLFISWFGAFGVMPAILWSRRSELRQSWHSASPWQQAALIYGLALFMLAPAAGTQLPRLIGYGWPAFWLAAPLLVTIVPAPRRDLWLLAGLHATAAWGPPLLQDTFPVSKPWLGSALILAVVCNVMAARIRQRGGS